LRVGLALSIQSHCRRKSISFLTVLIFNNEDEQKRWNEWLKKLKELYPDKETISERIIQHIGEE